MNKINYKLLIYFLLAGLAKTNFARAEYIRGPIVPCNDNCTVCDFWHLGSNIINFITFNLALPIASLLFIVAGVIFLFAGGNENTVTRARGIFVNTFIGLVIIFSSWLIIDTFIKTVAKSEFSAAWESFPTCIQF